MRSIREFVDCELGNLPTLGHGSRLIVTFPTLIWFPLQGPSPKHTPSKLTQFDILENRIRFYILTN